LKLTKKRRKTPKTGKKRAPGEENRKASRFRLPSALEAGEKKGGKIAGRKGAGKRKKRVGICCRTTGQCDTIWRGRNPKFKGNL